MERDSGIWTIQTSTKSFSAQYIKGFAHSIKEPFKASPIVFGAHENGKELGLLLLESEWNDSLVSGTSLSGRSIDGQALARNL